MFALTVGLPDARSAPTQADQVTITRRAEYLPVNRMSEATLARSAPPKSIADHAAVLVLGKNDDTALKGGNGIGCFAMPEWLNGTLGPYGKNIRAKCSPYQHPRAV